MALPKEHSKLLVTDIAEKEITNCPDKVFKIFVLKKFRELKKHRLKNITRSFGIMFPDSS